MPKVLLNYGENSSIREITVSPRQELTFGVLSGYYNGKGYTLNEHFKTNLELLNSDKNYNYLAYLMADENGESFRVAKYSGDNKLDLIENNEYGYCCLINALNNILNKFKVENPTKTKITYYKRYEANLVDADALKEIIINAFAHNDYSTGFTPIFEIYNNRFEITSYGGLLPTQSEEDLFSGISMPRNKELVRIFRDLNLVEQLGTGMKKILRHYGRDIYTIKDSYIKVTVPFRDTDRYLDYLISQDQANNHSNHNTAQTNLF